MHMFVYLWKHFAYSEKTKSTRISFFVLLIMSIIYGSYISYEKPELTFIDIVYYLFVTITTVGYGEITPAGQMAKILCIFYMIFGIVLLALLFGELTNRIQRLADKERKGEIKVKTSTKLLIIGYPSDEKVKELIMELRADKRFKKEQIICLTNSIEEKPEWFSDYQIKFKKGVASNSEVLNDINITEIEIALVLAEDSDDITSDDLSSSAVAVIEALSPETRTIVEKVRKDELLFRVSNADVITRVAYASVLAQEILDEGALEFESYVFSNSNGGTQLNVINDEEQSWLDLAISFVKEDKNAEGYRNPGEKKFNFTPKKGDIVKKGALIKYRNNQGD